MSLPAGTLIAGRFEIVRQLGSGGYAVVYEAVDRELRRRVAVKVLRTERVGTPAVARMRREVAVARDVVSPRLVRLYDIAEDGRLTFISMELVEGCSLRDRIADGPMSVEEVLAIGDQILEALEHLHDARIIHRDLKPANILLTSDGGVKLADFGLARHWENEEMQVTRSEALVGTMGYLSPEQALGNELDPRSDLYSFGVVLFEMLAGALPFGGASSLGTAIAHVSKRAPDLREVRPDLPRWLAILVQRLLEKEPAHRPASAAEVRRILGSRKTDWSYGWRRSRLRVAAFVLLLGAAILGGGWGWNHHWSRFERIGFGADGTLHTYDRRGRVLWSRANVGNEGRAAIVTIRPGERVVATIPLDDPSKPSAAETSRPLLLLDPQTGDTARTIQLPDPPRVFPIMPYFSLAALRPVDTDHDGAEEVVAMFVHTYWPSYSLLVDPGRGRVDQLLFASGHHRPVGAVDLDGDGIDEVLFLGPNNRMGWRTGVAAVSARRGPGGARLGPAETPDMADRRGSPRTIWYTLLQRDPHYSFEIGNVDAGARTFDLVSPTGSRIGMTFDGFLSGSGNPGDVAARRAAREDAFRMLREAQMAESLGEFDRAIELGDEARAAAERAGERELADWASTAVARTHARSERTAELRVREIERILSTTNGGPELCWEVGRVFSARGEPRLAADWFARGLSLTPPDWTGRPPSDYVTEAVVAMAELHAWDEAIDLLDGFRKGNPMLAEGDVAPRAFVLWRTGGRMDHAAAGLGHPTGWLRNYWILEYLWSAERPDLASLLASLEERIDASLAPAWTRSLEAEVLAALGRPDEALQLVRQAWESVNENPEDATARIHREIVEKRLREIEAAVAVQAGSIR